MSSQQPFTPLPGDVQHVHQLSDQLNKLYLSDEYSDVTLVVQANRFSAHKVILAARSEYFRALLYGGMRESAQAEVELKGTPLLAFRHLLKYIYTGHISLSSFKEEMILDILSLAHQYGFPDLEAAISDYLKAVLSIGSVCLIYDTSALFHLDTLAHSCLVFMDRHAVEILTHESFTSLSESSVREIISRDSFCAEEVQIFRAVSVWAAGNPEAEYSKVLKEIRLSLLSIQDLLKVVRPTELLPPDVLLDAIQSRTESKDT
jgi:BTB/POZ domain-containing protein 9